MTTAEVNTGLPGIRVTPEEPERSRSLLVAIDPATTSGWAAFVDGVLVDAGAFRVTTPVDAFRLLRRLAKENEGSELLLIIEDQYLFTPKVSAGDDAQKALDQAGNRFRSTAKVVRIHGWWEAAGTICGYAYRSALAQQWQGPVGVVQLAKLRFGGDRKKASREIAASRYHRAFSSDEADAVLLGSWYEVERRRLPAEVKVAARRPKKAAEPEGEQLSLLRKE